MAKKLLKKDNLFVLVFTILAIHPIIELDYLGNTFFNNIFGARPSTIIDFVILPLLVVLLFWLYEKNKKKILIIIGIYAILLIAYFIPHCLVGEYLQDNIHLSYTFMFTVKDEIIYIVTLLLPVVYVYIFNYHELAESILKRISICLSSLVSIPIVISNLLQFGLTTYGDVMKGSIIDWFSLPFNDTENHPRRYATKFFFEEGNTIGILLTILLPVMYYFFLKESNKIKKTIIGVLIVLDSLAMFILGTRVAAYCAILIPAVIVIVHIFTVLIKTEQLKKGFIVFCVALTIVNSVILPYCPAYQNQQFDASDFSTLKLNDSIRETYRAGISEGAEGMEPFGKEWIDYYCYMFLQYKFLIGVTPAEYYEYWYDYRVDPKFWVDLIFNYDLEERVNARQLENIFYKYKWALLTPTQKLTGFTYSLFMWGGINIEQDFIQQFYSFGYLGYPLIMGPWFIIFAYIIYKFLKGFKTGKWTFFNFMLLMSISLGVVTSVASGHGFDQLSVSMFISLCCAYIIKRVNENEKKA